MTAGQWEQYVADAAVPLDPNAFDRSDPQHDHWALDMRRGIAMDRARKVLAVAGPRIAEDTRTRLVEAAAVAVERDPVVDAARLRTLHGPKPIPQPAVFTSWCDQCNAAWPCQTATILDGTR